MASWLLFIPQFSGGGSRVKLWRGLQRLGALSLKGAVWVLPDLPATREALRWARHEFGDDGVDVVIARTELIEGLDDGQLRTQFKTLATERWQALGRELSSASARQREALTRRFEDAERADFFSAPGKAEATRLLARLRAPSKERAASERFVGRTWVTRCGIYVDRMASAWLIRRFIDPRAKLRFVDLTRQGLRAGELGYDFDGARFTHEGQRCSFEVLQHRFQPKDRALKVIGELVHDLDFKDGRFGRPQTAGFGQQLAAIASAHDDDFARLERASALLDDLYAHLRRG